MTSEDNKFAEGKHYSREDLSKLLDSLPTRWQARDYSDQFVPYLSIAQREVADFKYQDDVTDLVTPEHLTEIATYIQTLRVCMPSRAQSAALIDIVIYMLAQNYIIAPK